MAGILDSKSRIVDFILTNEGRRQISTGDLEIEFASFTDRDTFYEEESDGCASDATSRIYFEATGRYQDQIVVESNAGVITNFSTSDFDLAGTKVSTSPKVPRGADELNPLTGSALIENSSKIVTEITKNFYDQEMLSNEDVFSTRQGFDISREVIEFLPNPKTPLDLRASISATPPHAPIPSLEDFQNVLNDARLEHFEQFKFMPPENLENTEFAGKPLGFYPNFNQKEITSYEEIKENLKGIPSFEIDFDPTSRDNNIIIQPFEFGIKDGSSKIEKLQIIDFGLFANDSGTSSGVRVFFVGKLKTAEDGRARFLNIFTLELDV